MLSRLRSWLFPVRTLDDVKTPTHVRVDGVILGKDDRRSTVTGRGGILLEYRFYDRIELSNDGERQRYSDRLVTSGRIGEALMIDVAGRVVLVPVERRVEIEFAGEWDAGLLQSLLPDSLADAHPQLQSVREELRYDEKALHAGQRVRIVGHVAPVKRVAGGIYRGGPGLAWDYEVRLDLGDLIIEELA